MHANELIAKPAEGRIITEVESFGSPGEVPSGIRLVAAFHGQTHRIPFTRDHALALADQLLDELATPLPRD